MSACVGQFASQLKTHARFCSVVAFRVFFRRDFDRISEHSATSVARWPLATEERPLGVRRVIGSIRERNELELRLVGTRYTSSGEYAICRQHCAYRPM